MAWSSLCLASALGLERALEMLLLDKGAELETRDDEYSQTLLSFIGCREQARRGREAALGERC